MIQQERSLIDELYRVDGKAEIVHGEIVRMSPTGGLHGIAVGLIYQSLYRHQKRYGGGTAFPDNVGFLVQLPTRQSFSPDVAWHPCNPEEVTEAFIQGAPSFAVEVRSPGDYLPAGERELAAKIKDYLAAGTLVVWDVDLRNGIIHSHHASHPDQPQLFQTNERANAEPAVAGWEFAVKRLRRS